MSERDISYSIELIGPAAGFMETQNVTGFTSIEDAELSARRLGDQGPGRTLTSSGQPFTSYRIVDSSGGVVRVGTFEA